MNRYENFTKSQKGYSMVEVLVTMLIVPFGLLGVAKFQSNIMVVGAETKTRTEALYAAEQKIEEIRTFANTTSYNGIADGNDIVSANPGSNATLNRSWSITNSSSPNYKTITVDVAWTGSDEQPKSVTLTSYVSMADPVMSGKLVLADTTPTPVTPLPSDPTPDPDPDPTPNPDPIPGPDPTPNPQADPDPMADPGPTSYSITISGFINYEGNGNKNWSVSIDGTVCDSGSNSSSYSCVLNGIPLSDAPSLTVSLSTTGTVCGTGSVNQNFSSSDNYGSQNFTHAQNSNRCS